MIYGTPRPQDAGAGSALPTYRLALLRTGSFVYFRFPPVHGVSLPDTVALEHLHGTTFVDTELDVNMYQVAFSVLRDNSLNPGDSRDELVRVARERWQ